ncbi:MAG: DUF2332 domain-containing protein [Rhodobacteraceae bacterium]|nr:DUF2332 domain-containing protein [Paracoccaceae bacterium]
MNLRDALKEQAKNNEALGSPFTARVLRLLAEGLQPGTELTDRIFDWQGDIGPHGASVPLRLLGGLHALVLNGASPDLAALYPPHPEPDDDALWTAIHTAMTTHAGFLDHWLNNAPQTNEVRRAAILIAAGHWLTREFGLPLALSELGASGGLNLMWDHFALAAGGKVFGPENPAFTLSPDWSGPFPPLTAPTLHERRGVDLNPLDPADPADALRLTAYLWADQPERLARTQAAMNVANAPVDKGDAAAWLTARLATPRHGQTHLVYHTIAWQYFPRATQIACENALEAAGKNATKDAPLARLSMEADGGKGAALTLWLWQGDQGAARKISLGRVDFHGRWVDWQAG